MKLRIRGNSLRLRLLRGEVAELGSSGKVSETINFGVSKLTYTLKISNDESEISAEFGDSEIVVSLPKGIAGNWIETDSVSLEATQKISAAEDLQLLIEKDFVCLDRPNDADNTDAYPHL